MRIWKYVTDSDHYYTLALSNYQRDGWFVHRIVHPAPLPQPLPVIEVRYETEPKDLSPSQRRLLRQGKLPKGDFPSFYGLGMVFSEKALHVFEPLVRDSTQIIPLQCSEDKLYLIHVTNAVDCLDLERSAIRYLLGDTIFDVRHYEFKNVELLENKYVFKMTAKGLHTQIYVTDAFRELVEKHELKGLLWNPLP